MHSADSAHKEYFKGWYFKCCTREQTVAFIPAYHRGKRETCASLQVITDEEAFMIPFDSLNYREKELTVSVGDCVFSKQGIALHFENEACSMQGALNFRAFSPIRYDIMGPFAAVPFMQCRHRVYSMAHPIDGTIAINGRSFTFCNGIGYIEGDRGHSFPSDYIWTQCCFENGSLMLSVADIPLCGMHFNGVIGVILLDGKEYRIATYLGARVCEQTDNAVTVRQGPYLFTAKLLQKNAQPLFAPTNGSMCRTIHESASCKAYYRFSVKETVLCEFVSERAGFEFEIQSPTV